MLEVLDVKDSVITVDTFHCQYKTLDIISEKKVHVVVQVKKNKPKLYAAVFDAHKEKVVTHIKLEIHSRKEERYVYQLKAHLPTELIKKWPTIRSIIAVERHRAVKNKRSIDTSYYISSMSPKHKMLGHYICQIAVLEIVKIKF